ncbi:MAG: tetratricopeptide repeat protein [Gammaproteobacteria bacterium]
MQRFNINFLIRLWRLCLLTAGSAFVLTPAVMAADGQQATNPNFQLDNVASASCREQLRSENNLKAIEAANVALTRLGNRDNPDLRFDELVCRGSAYENYAETESAERDYREALRLASRNFDPFDVRLIDPLTRLGRIRLAQDDPGEAELFLLEAQGITHRTAGIYNVQQKEVLDDLTNVYMRQKRSQQANRQQELRLRSARETYGETPELVEALQDYAKWNATAQRFPKVRVALEEAITILEDAYGVNDPRLIDTLRLRAQLYKLHPTISTPKAGEEAMQRVVDIYASREFVDQVDLLVARTALGDWYLQGLKMSKALKYYKKTVQQALAENVDPELLEEIYGKPRLFFIDSTKRTFFSPNESGDLPKTGILRYRYKVTAKGRARQARLIEDTVNNAEIKIEIQARLKEAVFRPRYVNGKATATHNVEQVFRFKRTGSSLAIDKIYAPVLIKP